MLPLFFLRQPDSACILQTKKTPAEGGNFTEEACKSTLHILEFPALHEKRYYKQNTHWGAYKQSQRAILSTVNFEIRVLTVSFM